MSKIEGSYDSSGKALWALTQWVGHLHTGTWVEPAADDLGNTQNKYFFGIALPYVTE